VCRRRNSSYRSGLGRDAHLSTDDHLLEAGSARAGIAKIGLLIDQVSPSVTGAALLAESRRTRTRD